MSPKQYERTFPWLNKTLGELDAPVFDLTSPLKQFTAQLHTLNYFFWSTEIAYANLLRAYGEYQESAQPAPAVLENCSASAFKPRVGTKKPHYAASMGSLIVQTRWNYDRLARQVIVEAHSALERLVAARATPVVGEKIAQGPFHKLWRALAKAGYHLDPLTTYRTQLYREIRNNVVHDFSTIHSFPNSALINRAQKVRVVAETWSTDADWPAALTKVFNEIMWTTRRAADGSDLPQLFFIAVFALSRPPSRGVRDPAGLQHRGRRPLHRILRESARRAVDLHVQSSPRSQVLSWTASGANVPTRRLRPRSRRGPAGRRADGFPSRADRWHDGSPMTPRSKSGRARGDSLRIDRATYRPGDYGRVTQEDGTDRWWVRSPDGGWTPLSHQRVAENDDGTITLLYLK